MFFSKKTLGNTSRDSNIVLVAEHHNWGLQIPDDWHQTKYILFEDGTLQKIVFIGASINSYNVSVSEKDVKFIQKNLEKFIRKTPEIEAYDGSAWKFEGPGCYFRLGYIYGSELEKIAEILNKI